MDKATHWRTPLFTWLRALIYMVIVATGWLVVLPELLLFFERCSFKVTFRSRPFVLLGAVTFLAGSFLGIAAGGYLIQKGHGTPLPLDPPQELVTTGPYRWVRNPQAIAMILAVLGEIMALKSRRVWLLLPLTIIYLEVLVKPWEERQLLAAHGERYLAYKKAVPRWLPKPAKNAEWQTLLETSQKQIGV
jgi:protein-S-isoprenylcysteine O-methyltransferase Ste14